jgi:opacity protein-like surface antigen
MRVGTSIKEHPMTCQLSSKTAAVGTIAAALLALPAISAAQTTPGRTPSRSFIPYTSNGYFGVNLGKGDYRKNCVGGFECKDPDIAGKLYTGGLFSRVIGVELGYINTGNADRNGGEIKAQGVNLSVVGNLPLTDTFNLFAKGGTTYAWTEETAAPGTGIATGDTNGFGLSYGAGLGYDVTRDIQLVAEWDRNRFKFVSGRQNVDLYSVGVRFKF